MTCEEFVDIKDNILQLSGRDLAMKLKAPASSVSSWSKPVSEGGREIPDYIAELLYYLVKEKLGTLTLTLTVSDIRAIIRLAAERGLSFEGLLISLIRSAITPGEPTAPPARNLTYNPEEIASSRLNELDTPSP